MSVNLERKRQIPISLSELEQIVATGGYRVNALDRLESMCNVTGLTAGGMNHAISQLKQTGNFAALDFYNLVHQHLVALSKTPYYDFSESCGQIVSEISNNRKIRRVRR